MNTNNKLLDEARALVERSRQEIAIMNIQNDTKEKMNNETAVDSELTTDPLEKANTSDVKVSLWAKPEGVLTADAVGRLYRTGMSVDAIAKANGVSYPTARKLLRASGVELRDPSSRLTGRTRRKSS